MRVRTLTAIALVSLASGMGARDARAATDSCPSECRREVAQVLCSTIETVSDGTTRIVRYYWSS